MWGRESQEESKVKQSRHVAAQVEVVLMAVLAQVVLYAWPGREGAMSLPGGPLGSSNFAFPLCYP